MLARIAVPRLLFPALCVLAGVLPALTFPVSRISEAQGVVAPCGVVDQFDFPVPGIDLQRTDFAIYRARFGGLHTGIDVAFEQWGEPVRAAAAGRVTYSDPAGWGSEKGVVVIQHTMPDGTLVHTIYGHMEELNGYTFPAMNACVERGEIVGAIGFPSRGRPHLHYEVRTRYWHQGGPGYTETNPLELGWYHPVDFTYLANIWVQPAYRGHFSLTHNATLPLLHLDDGTYVRVRDRHLQGLGAGGDVVWQFDAPGTVTGLLALPDRRVLAATAGGQVLVLSNGLFDAAWEAQDAVSTPILLGDRIVFATEHLTLAAYSPDGTLVWETPPLPAPPQRWVVNQGVLAIGTRSGHFIMVNADGQPLTSPAMPDMGQPIGTAAEGFLVFSNSRLIRLTPAGEVTQAFTVEWPVTPTAQAVEGPDGQIYLYGGEGRSLYAYRPNGDLEWVAYMPGSHLHPPLLGVGGGQRLYALTTDGQLLAYDTADGHLVARLLLFDGGIEGTAAARWLEVSADDMLGVSAGYLSVVMLDGLALSDSPPAG